VLVGCIVAALLSWLMLVPGTTELNEKIIRAEQLRLESNRRTSTLRSQLAFVERAISNRVLARNAITQSIEYRGRQLLQRNWRAMRGVEWEAYLCEVFQAHGAIVETTKTTGDQGVDLIVIDGGRRCAVQAKGYDGSVGNSAVQQAVAGMA